MVKFIATLARARIHIDARQLLIFLAIGVALPNSIPGLVAWHFGFYRAAINLDYLVPFLLLAVPRQGFRAAGAVLLVLLSLVDCALILLEYFPTLNLGDILYLLGFIFSADNVLIILFCGAVLYLAFLTFISLRYSRCLQTVVPGLAIFVALILQTIIHHAEPFSTSYIRNGLAESRLAFLIENKDRSFFNILNADVLHESGQLHLPL